MKSNVAATDGSILKPTGFFRDMTTLEVTNKKARREPLGK